MNILTEHLPESVRVGDEEYKIKTDFKTWIRFAQAIFSSKGDYEELANAICAIFEEAPPNFMSALSAMMDFYTLNKKGDSKDTETPKQQIFDFDIDSGLIYAAFLQQYRIDLTKADIHWWAFKTLFDNLSEDTQFIKVMQFRCKDISSIKDKEMKNYYIRMKRRYALPDNRSEKEKENAFANALGVIS